MADGDCRRPCPKEEKIELIVICLEVIFSMFFVIFGPPFTLTLKKAIICNQKTILGASFFLSKVNLK